MLLRPTVALCGAALLLATSVSGSPADTACLAEVSEAEAAVSAAHGAGQTDLGPLLSRFRELKTRHATGPPACRSSILREEIVLTNFVGDYPEAIRLSTTYLEGPLGTAFPDDRMFVLRVRGYAREALGLTVAGAQDYFEAAAGMHDVPALSAYETLVEAGQTALELGDLDGAERYYDEAEGLMHGALSAGGDQASCLRLRIGRLYVERATLTERRLRQTSDPAEIRRLASPLRTQADAATALLSAECGSSLVPLIDIGNEAAAHSAAALGHALSGDLRAARAALSRAEARLAASRGSSRIAGHSVWMRAAAVHSLAGDWPAARRAASAAHREGRRTGIVTNEAAATEALAEVAEQQGRLGEAEALFHDALRLREIQRERLELQDWNVAAFAAAQAPYYGLTRLLVGRGQPEEALRMLDRSRARHLQDLRQQVRLRERLAPSQRLQADSVLTAIEEARVAQVRDPHGPPGREAALRISRLQARLHHITSDFRREPESELDLPALKRTLGRQNRTLVSYALGERSSLAFVVTPAAVTAHRLEVTRAGVDRLLAEAAGPWADVGDPAVQLGPLHGLYRALVEPIAGDLPAGSGLVIVPDGALAAVPFGALLETPATHLDGAAFLVRSRAVSTELAAALVAGADGEAAEPLPLDLVAIGRGRYGGGDATVRGMTTRPLNDLPHAVREVRQIAAHVRRRRVAVEHEATRDVLLQGLQTSRLVHVASHAIADPVFPMHSRLFLWPQGADDGVVYLHELQAEIVRADLVVLSGCSTARGKAQRGEGPMGLNYGLRAAGAQATLATLWPVDDEATAFVTTAFYDALAEGLPKDRALQRAQVAYLDAHSGVQASPYFWAAPVLSGNPAAVQVEPRRPLLESRALGGAIAFGLLGLGLAWRLRRRPFRA